VVGVERWAEIRRLYFVEGPSKRAISKLIGVHRDTVTRAIKERGAAEILAGVGGVEARSVQGVDLRAVAGQSNGPVVAAARDGS
jgi:transposase